MKKEIKNIVTDAETLIPELDMCIDYLIESGIELKKEEIPAHFETLYSVKLAKDLIQQLAATKQT